MKTPPKLIYPSIARTDAIAIEEACKGCFDRWMTCGDCRRNVAGHVVVHVVIDSKGLLLPRLRVLRGEQTIGTLRDDWDRDGAASIDFLFRGDRQRVVFASDASWGTVLARETGPQPYFQRCLARLTASRRFILEQSPGPRTIDLIFLVRLDTGASDRSTMPIVPVPDEDEFFRLARTPFEPPHRRIIGHTSDPLRDMLPEYIPDAFKIPKSPGSLFGSSGGGKWPG